MIFAMNIASACEHQPASSSAALTQRSVDEVRVSKAKDPLLLELKNIKLPPGADGARIFLIKSPKSSPDKNSDAKEYVGQISVGHQSNNAYSSSLSSVQELPDNFSVSGDTKPSEISVLIQPLKQGEPISGNVKVDSVLIRPDSLK